MASITSLANGRKRLQFIGLDGDRKAVRLGKVSDAVAEKFKANVEALLSATRLNETPDEKVRKWLAGLDAATYAKLAAVGVVRARDSLKIGAFIDACLANRA